MGQGRCAQLVARSITQTLLLEYVQTGAARSTWAQGSCSPGLHGGVLRMCWQCWLLATHTVAKHSLHASIPWPVRPDVHLQRKGRAYLPPRSCHLPPELPVPTGSLPATGRRLGPRLHLRRGRGECTPPSAHAPHISGLVSTAPHTRRTKDWRRPCCAPPSAPPLSRPAPPTSASWHWCSMM